MTARVRHLSAGGCVLLLVFALMTPGAAGVEPTLEDISDAIRFREPFGLRTDPGFLSRTSELTNHDWGVPLTESEAAEIARRADLPRRLTDPLSWAYTHPDFAGAYMDHDAGGLVVIQFKAADISRLTTAVVARAPAGSPIDVRSAARSRADLEAVRAQIYADADWFKASGLELISTAIAPTRNALRVGIRGATETASELLGERYGPAVYVIDDDYSVLDACTVDACWPQKGGIKVFPRAAPAKICTSGFGVRFGSPVQYGLLTAGHCIKLGGAGTYAHSNAAAQSIGTPTGHTYFANATADAAIIKMNAPGIPIPSTLNYYVFQNEDTNAVSRVAPLSEQIAGAPVCMSGWGTWHDIAGSLGNTCGQIVIADQIRNSCEDAAKLICQPIQHQYEMNFDTRGGDSGGPISVGVSTAIGLLTDSVKDGTGNRSWYSPLVWAMPAIDALPNEGRWRVCLNATCTAFW